MQIQFALDDFGDETASRQAAEDGLAPAEPYHLWGQLVLEHPGQPTVAIKDDLTTLCFRACVDLPADLKRDGRALLRLVSWPGEFSFTGEGADQWRLQGPKGEEALYPRREFIEALHACGVRLASFMSALSTTSSQFASTAKSLTDKL